MRKNSSVAVPVAPFLFPILPLLLVITSTPARAVCPPGSSYAITSGSPAEGPPIVLSGLGGRPVASFFLLGSGDANNSGTLSAADWLRSVGDVDGDGLPDWIVEAPGTGAGGWGDVRAAGCPAFASPPNPPLVILISHDEEDLDSDGRFDVYEDFRPHNGTLDPFEDLDGDGRLTPEGGCEGVSREDKDCDHHLDFIDEDDNHNGVLDPGEDRDGDGRLDDGTEDRNRNFSLDDRPDPAVGNDLIPDAGGHFGNFYPYGSARPSGGGVIVLSVGWNGTAYDLQALNTPTVGLGSYRLVAPTPLDRARVHVGGTRLDTAGALRLDIAVRGLTLSDDAGGTRVLFDAALLQFPEPPPCASGCPPSNPPALPRFVANDSQTLRIGSGANLAFDTFVSILPLADKPSRVGPFFLFPQSPGSEMFLSRTPAWPGNPTPNLLDADRDLNSSAPAYAPIDNCPDLRSTLVADANHDGIGDACDPSSTGGDVPNRWLAGAPGPGPRVGAAAAYDAGRGVMVLFGGADNSQTWEFDGTWRLRLTDTAPAPRQWHGMAYDSVRRRIVLYGGQSFTTTDVPTTLGDQWEFDGLTGAWTRVMPAASPGPRLPFGLVYDEARQALVLYGGEDPRLPWYDSIKQDTWMYQNGAWRTVPTPRSPGPRRDGAMAWDGFHRVTVLMGGLDYDGKGTGNDTWEFDGVSWQPVDTRGDLPPGSGGVASWDAARRQVLLFGGGIRTRGSLFSDVPSSGERTAAMRAYDGVRWRFLPSLDTPQPKNSFAGVFDQGVDRFFVHGGLGECCNNPIDTTSILDLGDDVDGDGVADAADDCPHAANADQADGDGDGSGDVCDDCPGLPNPDQRDRDRDGLGDPCDADRDGDGVPNATDVCPDTVVPGRPASEVLTGGGPDTDGDGIPDDCDLFPSDPANDGDGDGIADSVDNCPLAPNPGQADSNGDGTGDACQAFVRIVSIAPAITPPRTLEALVALGDPDGDKPFGQVTIEPAAIVPEVVTAQKDPCSNAFLPEGRPGEGIVYAVVPFAQPALVDVDSGAGCHDGLADYQMFYGPCSYGAFGSTMLPLDRPTPFPICVRQASSYYGFDYVVERVTPTEVVLAAGLPLVFSVEYAKGRLPHSLALGSLPAAGPYVLRITAGDGTTPEVAAERLFDWNGERTLVFTLGGKKSLARPTIRIPHVY